MSDELVERVARALLAAFFRRKPLLWDEATEEAHNEMRLLARAAIEAAVTDAAFLSYMTSRRP